MKFIFHAHHTPLFISTKACGPTILFEVILTSSKVALTAFTIPSLEIPILPWKFQVAHELVLDQ